MLTVHHPQQPAAILQALGRAATWADVLILSVLAAALVLLTL